MEKSTLLLKIIAKSKSFGADGKEIIKDGEYIVCLDKLFIETLNLVAEYAEKGEAPDCDTDEARQEIQKTRTIFDGYNINYKATADRIAEYIRKNPTAYAVGELQYRNLISMMDIFSGIDGGFGTLTLDRFIAESLQCPTDPIRNYVIGVDESAPAEDDDDDEREDALAEEIDEEIEQEEKKKKEGADSDLFTDLFGLDDDDEDEEEELLPTLADVAKKSRDVHRYLSSKVYGQDVAVNTFVSGYFQAELTALTDKQRTRPRATFLFAGPPGVGKTYLSEQVAKALGLPFKRFDMSEYSDKEANIEFCGSDKVYKNAKEGNVTGFVAENPKAILLFDEVEKAHLNVIHLFLQILDAGRLRDNYTDEEVSFKDTIVILTTNAGKQLYEDESINLATVSRKSTLKALAQDINPVTGAPSFPAAICSRFAYGNVVMFNRMSANYLLQIADGELSGQVKGIREGTGIDVTCDPLLPYAIIYAEGGVADARTVKGKSGAFIFRELYELFRLMQSEKKNYAVDKIKKVDIKVELPKDPQIVSLFKSSAKSNILVFAAPKVASKCKKSVKDASVYVADSIDAAREILDNQDISLILCDVTCRPKNAARKVLNIEDVESEGRDFMYYAVERGRIPVYVLQPNEGDISEEEFASLASVGALGLISLNGGKDINEAVNEKCRVAYQQKNLAALARANKVLTHKTLQTVSKDGTKAVIALFDFRLTTALDAGDTKGMVDGVSKPDVKFDDVIGAKDAKEELTYFIDFLKNSAKFIKRGVRPPKGILLYGPPGTGKTLLAKAMAGESDVTFIRAEGNQFLKKYVGEGSESVHKLFTTARKYAPSILFIDEIDAIGKGRGDNSSHSDDVLTSFLTEMDGFNTDLDRPVFVLAATNYDIEQGTTRSLDPALLRRFDRKIFVDLPNKEERIQFIRKKLAKVRDNKISDDEVENIAVRSTGTSLADLDSVFELAIRNVIKSDGFVLSDEVLEEAFETFNCGDAKKWNESELMRTARHEAGHALICYLGGEVPSYLTIVARGSHGGYMQHADNEGKGTYTKKELLSRVRTALGGRAAEVVYYGDEDGVSTGASGDLHTATAIIENMICSYGMDETVGLGSVDLRSISSAPHYAKIVARVNELLAREFNTVKCAIEQHREAIDELVKVLLEKNALKSNEIEEILKKTVK